MVNTSCWNFLPELLQQQSFVFPFTSSQRLSPNNMGHFKMKYGAENAILTPPQPRFNNRYQKIYDTPAKVSAKEVCAADPGRRFISRKVLDKSTY